MGRSSESRSRRSRSRESKKRSRHRSRSKERRKRSKRSRSPSEQKSSKRRSRSPSQSSNKINVETKVKSNEKSVSSNSRQSGVLTSEGAATNTSSPLLNRSAEVEKAREQARLEQEMQRRRERIEKWRAEKKLRELETMAAEAAGAARELTQQQQTEKSKKKWSLEDDNEDDNEENEDSKKEGKNGEAEEEEEEEDPLDAFMAEVNKEVKKQRASQQPAKAAKAAAAAAAAAAKASGTASNNVVIMTGVAKRSSANHVERRRGELIEQNQDGLAFFDDDEEASKDSTLEDAMNKLNNKGKKELMKIDHTNIVYEPFMKDFYREPPELARMTNEEVEALREKMEGIRVKGKNVAKPIQMWAHCGLTNKMLDQLKKLNYTKPTPIQMQAIPVVMSGRDLIGIAKTGSGKTLAFLLPLLRHIAAQPPLEDGDGPMAIIMAPTRELCLQIGKETRLLQKAVKGKIRSVCVYGGTGISEQIAELKRGAEIVVCTPGRMIDMLAANSGRVTNLQRVTFVVLDEADRMFDMGFEPQVMRIIDNCRPDKQMVMFSATFPRQMEALARRILIKPVEVVVGGRSVVCKDIEQHVHVLDEEAKFLKLLEVLGQRLTKKEEIDDNGKQELAIVFVDKQENADALLKDLMAAGYTSSASLHGGIDQYDRDSTITSFKQGRIQVLVATSVAARGLDVKELKVVVNFDCPNHYEDYVHRCGRTGRAGNKGYAHTFLCPDQGRLAGEVKRALELSEALVPEHLRTLWDNYVKKAEAEGKKIKGTGGGFGGSGFKFDASEAGYTNEKKKFQKTIFGLHDSDDEDVEQEIEQQIEQMLNPKRSVKTIDSSSNTGTTTPTTSSAAASQKLELAKKLASQIELKKSGNIGQMAAEQYLSGGGFQAPVITAKTVADHMAAKLNAKLNYMPSEEEEAAEAGGSDQQATEEKPFQKFEEELIINDFPQQARWKVTSKEAMAEISEYSDAGITVRGSYFPPGKSVPEGERKLYLAIESTNELSVQKAKVEITRLLKEELLRLSSSSSAAFHNVNKARYKVL